MKDKKQRKKTHKNTLILKDNQHKPTLDGAESLPPYDPEALEADGFNHERHTKGMIAYAIQGVLDQPYLKEKIEDRPNRALAHVKLGVEYAKRNVFGGDNHEERACRNELTLAMEAHTQEFGLLRDFAQVFSRMDDHVDLIYETLLQRLALMEREHDTAPGGLGRDADLGERLTRTIQFVSMLMNVPEGRDPLTGAQEEDINGKY